ncbi:glycosyltransferase [Aliiruegeria sabulilitoris]|uniref:glycosyltransferase n=1 Tax=Aliiruegeria sabulilitoris TaxID=1510458 RepID=UPI000831D5DA|nr:glycosyltransferase [Aliiruegeria sabulilitoris]NDR57060.1 glycosyltransferase [Pseudoruegeria sp. M32A2M]
MFNAIIPAHNEEAYIGPTLEGLLEQDGGAPKALRVIVAANGCSDRTAEIAASYAPRFEARGWEFVLLDIPEGGKTGALNRADAAAAPGPRAYIDADVICSPTLLGELATILDTEVPRYASGRFTVAPPSSWASRHYARLWLRLPFMASGVPGCGLFAMNEAGRARWAAFPPIIADDLFSRLNFAPDERFRAEAPFSWVLAEGFSALVRVRRRWDEGNRQLFEQFPDLSRNEEKAPVRLRDHVRLLLGQPVSYGVYVAVALASRTGIYDRGSWARGR